MHAAHHVQTKPLAAAFLPFMAEWVEPEIKESLPPSTLIKKKRGGGRKPTVQKNTLKPYLEAFSAPGLALAAAPELNTLVTGAVYLDMGGNTRPLSKKLILSMLLRLDEISTKAVQDYMHLTLRPCKDRQAQNIACCLRVIINAAAKLSLPELPTTNMNYNIDPCGNPRCAICTATAANVQPWDVSPDCDEENMEDFAVELDVLN